MAIDKNKTIKQVQTDTSETYEIVPSKISDVNSSFTASLPTLNQDSVLTIDSDLKNYLLLTGGTMTGPITIASGDGQGILFKDKTSNINIIDGNTRTLVGFLNGNFTLGYPSYNVNIRGYNLDIYSAGNAGLYLKGVPANTDYAKLGTQDANRVFFIQPGTQGTVTIGGDIANTSVQGDKSAKLIVHGDIKENGIKLTDKYQAKGSYAAKVHGHGFTGKTVTSGAASTSTTSGPSGTVSAAAQGHTHSVNVSGTAAAQTWTGSGATAKKVITGFLEGTTLTLTEEIVNITVTGTNSSSSVSASGTASATETTAVTAASSSHTHGFAHTHQVTTAGTVENSK